MAEEMHNYPPAPSIAILVSLEDSLSLFILSFQLILAVQFLLLAQHTCGPTQILFLLEDGVTDAKNNHGNSRNHEAT